MKRPKSVTVICVILLGLCAINLLSIASGLWNGVSETLFKEPVSAGEALIGMAVTALCAFFMLRGANWARWLYLGWVVIGTVLAALIMKSLLVLPGLLKTLVFGYFLTRADANEFFNGRPSEKQPGTGAA
jgi:hypothetical protein